MNEVGKRGSQNKDKIRAVLMKAEIGSWGNREGKGGGEAEPWRGYPSKVWLIMKQAEFGGHSQGDSKASQSPVVRHFYIDLGTNG